ncbi:hypothetical protein DEDE109153_08410 [Deinococcus deserti]
MSEAVQSSRLGTDRHDSDNPGGWACLSTIRTFPEEVSVGKSQTIKDRMDLTALFENLSSHLTYGEGTAQRLAPVVLSSQFRGGPSVPPHAKVDQSA